MIYHLASNTDILNTPRKNKKMKNCLKYLIAGIAAALVASNVLADEVVPKHVLIARDIEEHVKPENDYHVTSNRYVTTPSDWSLFGKKDYVVYTDCIGFVEAYMERAYGKMPQPSTKKFKSRYSIEDYVNAVDRGEMYNKVDRIQDLQVGDLLMWKFLPAFYAKFPSPFNGHIQLVNGAPERMETSRRKSLVQWKVPVLDNSSNATNPDDKRYLGENTEPDDGTFDKTSVVPQKKHKSRPGTGHGFVYIYTDREGYFKGISYGFDDSTIWMQDKYWHTLMAHPQTATKE